jgi:heme-binding protein
MKWFGAIGMFLLAICSAAVHPFGSVRQPDPSSQPAANELIVPALVGGVLERSCADCHSNRTAWPWYSRIAPVSWLVERDVRRGRDRLNFSNWCRYSVAERRKFLADIASAVENGQMPLPQYALMHSKAKLSDSERDAVYRWARLERRRLGSVTNPETSGR